MGTSLPLIQQLLIDNDVTVACLHDHPRHEALIDKDVSVVSRTGQLCDLAWPPSSWWLGLKEGAG